MDPITLILTALAAGAALGVKDTASAAVLDAYNGLEALVRRRLAGRENGDRGAEPSSRTAPHDLARSAGRPS